MTMEIDTTALKQEESVSGDGGTWLRGPLLGRGRFGDVHVAYFPEPSLSKRFLGFPSVVAVKSTDSFADINEEKTVYEALGASPFLLRCFGDDITLDQTPFLIGDDVTLADDDDYTLLHNIFLEYASGGTLERLIGNPDGAGLLEPQVRAFTRSILGGINHIHGAGFVHSDLHAGNILLVEVNKGFVAKIGDLGMAKREDDRNEGAEEAIVYCAPENIQGKALDVWALGCLVYAMLTGTLVPWGRAPRIEAIAEHGVSAEAKDFLRKCLALGPSDIPNAATLLGHPFVLESDEAWEEDRQRISQPDQRSETIGFARGD